MVEAILEINTVLNKTAKSNVDYSDLNVIKEACLEDFNTLNQRITDVCDVIDQIGNQIDRNEKEIEALKIMKTPKVNVIRKDIASPLRSSMSQHMGTNMHNRRTNSQVDFEKITASLSTKYFLKSNKHEKNLGDSTENQDYQYNTNPDKISVYNDSTRQRSIEKSGYKAPFNDDQIVVEDIDDSPSQNKYLESQAKHLSSKQSDYTFKADEIFRSSRENSVKNAGTILSSITEKSL